jgi:uncharacterized protein (DUF849 family)
MPLEMNREVFITCPVTGSGGTQERSPHVPRTPKEIADSAIEAAKAGAAIVHCHVRDPESGKASRRVDLYREVTERIRESDTDVVINLTAGMGGDLVTGPPDAPLPLKTDGTDMATAAERVEHVAECRPEICTLDCGTMNFAEADYVMTNTPGMLREMGQMMTDLDVRVEIEAFDTGHLWFAKQLEQEGIIKSPVLVQLCMGVPWGAPTTCIRSWQWSRTYRSTGTFRLSHSAVMKCRTRRRRFWPVATCVLVLKTIFISIKASLRPMHNWLNVPAASSRPWARPL